MRPEANHRAFGADDDGGRSDGARVADPTVFLFGGQGGWRGGPALYLVGDCDPMPLTVSSVDVEPLRIL